MSLHLIDWSVIVVYLLFALAVGLFVREGASRSREHYFLAARSLPWWWAGTSIAATTFAADTPLAITGIVADRGLSGNWMWLSWIGVHGAVIVYFATKWRRSEVLTDAEFVSLRYAGRSAEYLRIFRALLFAIAYNAIILGWVLRAMGKIANPIFRWSEWTPGLTSVLDTFWPAESALGSSSEGLTIVALIAVVGVYSTLGGIRGVIFTDLIQFAMALVGSMWLAFAAWNAVGGRTGLVSGLTTLYGQNHQYANLFPSFDSGWLHALGLGAFGFGMYLLVQSYANVPADGGGYFMQRLATCRDDREAKRAAVWFTGLHYLVRVWPWFVVALAALVLIPLGQEASALNGAGSLAIGDREMAYPALMFELLPAGVLGLMVASLLAAFMSTVDTHFNWGASYVVNDLYLKVRPRASSKEQVLAARITVAFFAVASILVAFRIDTIEQAWKWVAFIGAALGVPTALRWRWWRVNAVSEISAMVLGLGTAIVVNVDGSLPYEMQLVVVSLASVVGMVGGIAFGPRTPPDRVASFQQLVHPKGFWPGVDRRTAGAQVAKTTLSVFAVVAVVVALLSTGTWILFHA